MGSLSDDDLAGPSTTGPLSGQRPEEEGAPRYTIAPRALAAVEIPAVVENIDRTVKAFGRVPTLEHVSPVCFGSELCMKSPSNDFQGHGSFEKFNITIPESGKPFL